MMLAQLLRSKSTILTMILLLAAVKGGAATQELYGSVVGTVQDGSGAPHSGRHDRGSSTATTNLVLTAVSNETGAYTFTNVLPGTYDVKVTPSGIQGVRAADRCR